MVHRNVNSVNGFKNNSGFETHTQEKYMEAKMICIFKFLNLGGWII